VHPSLWAGRRRSRDYLALSYIDHQNVAMTWISPESNQSHKILYGIALSTVDTTDRASRLMEHLPI
jgi:hypothetical protein